MATGRLACYPTTNKTLEILIDNLNKLSRAVISAGIFSFVSVVILDDFSEVTTDLHQYNWNQK